MSVAKDRIYWDDRIFLTSDTLETLESLKGRLAEVIASRMVEQLKDLMKREKASTIQASFKWYAKLGPVGEENEQRT